MNKERKIEIIAWSGSLVEAEMKENEYWSTTTPYYRLCTIFDIRSTMYNMGQSRIDKVVKKYHKDDEEKSD